MKCVLVALAAARLVLSADFVLQEYLPPDTKVVMGLRLSSFTESSLFADQRASAKTLSENWTKLTAFAGFDPLHDIDEVILTSAADRENAPALLVLRGRFNLEKLGKGAEQYRGVAISSSKDKAAGVVGLLDATTALAGDRALVKAAIDRRGQPVIYDRALVARVASLRERFDVWGTGERPQGFVAPGGQNEQLNSIDRFEFGLRITHGLELSAEAHARSQKDADKLAASLALLQMMAQAQSKTAKFEVKAEDSTLKLSFAISEEELKKAIAAQRKPVESTPKITGQPNAVPPARQQTSPGGTSTFILPGKGQ
jgi:hypothetical protein